MKLGPWAWKHDVRAGTMFVGQRFVGGEGFSLLEGYPTLEAHRTASWALPGGKAISRMNLLPKEWNAGTSERRKLGMMLFK